MADGGKKNGGGKKGGDGKGKPMKQTARKTVNPLARLGTGIPGPSTARAGPSTSTTTTRTTRAAAVAAQGGSAFTPRAREIIRLGTEAAKIRYRKDNSENLRKHLARVEDTFKKSKAPKGSFEALMERADWLGCQAVVDDRGKPKGGISKEKRDEKKRRSDAAERKRREELMKRLSYLKRHMDGDSSEEESDDGGNGGGGPPPPGPGGAGGAGGGGGAGAGTAAAVVTASA